MKQPILKSLAALASFAAVALTGCGIATKTAVTVATPVVIRGAAFHGKLYGGQQPVVGSTIKLYAVGTANYGVGATYTTGTGNLLTSTVLTQSDGSFDVTNLYTCPSMSTQVYLVATGGNSGYTTNSNIAAMAALGPCGMLSANTFVYINEVSTVAAVYAFSPFMTGPAAIGTSANNTAGLANAAADINVLADLPSGSTPGAAPAGATVPNMLINTLANIIASCINSAGGSYNDNSNCGTLFYNANPGGTAGTAPKDTITALMNIAQHPATSPANITALYNLQSASPPFMPALANAPNDFTLALTFTGGGNINGPSSLAVDAGGNVWVTNASANSVTQLSHAGAGTTYSAGLDLNAPAAIAIGTAGNLWVANNGNNTVSRFTTAGAPVATYSGGGLNQPNAIAFDYQGQAWITNPGGNSVTTISQSGTVTAVTPAGAAGPLAVGVNPH